MNVYSKVDELANLGEKVKCISGEDKQSWRTESINSRYKRLNDLIYDMYAGEVQNGPFRGMKIAKNSTWKYSHVGQMILGIYESSVMEFLFETRNLERRIFIDIGAADGYYPIGLLNSGRMDKAYAFEINEASCHRIEKQAQIHGVEERLHVQLEATPASIIDLGGRVATSSAIVMLDVEGEEFQLLSEDVLCCFRNSVFIIEIHNWIDNFHDKMSRLVRSCEKYFTIDFRDARLPASNYLNLLAHWPDDNRSLILSEGRPCQMSYMVLNPIKGA